LSLPIIQRIVTLAQDLRPVKRLIQKDVIMLARWMVVDQNFAQFVKDGRLPAPRSNTTIADAGLTPQQFLECFDSQLTSRLLDIKSRILKEENKTFYTIGSSGHEGNAAIAKVLKSGDMSFLHYRSGAFMIERARALSDSNMTRDILLSMMASSEDPVCQGRHKVFGSRALLIPPQTSTISSHLPKAVGAAFSIKRGQELGIETLTHQNSLIICSFGDASLNHSTAQGAINSAEWIAHGRYPMPIIFVCEDNGIGISVPTPQDWIESSVASRPHIHYLSADGLNLADTYQKAKIAERIAREQKQPVFLHMRTIRLMGHAGSDIETHYWTDQQITTNEFQDPLLHSARILLDENIMSAEEIIALYEAKRAEIDQEYLKISSALPLKNAEEVMQSIIPGRRKQTFPLPLIDESRENAPRNMCRLINQALQDILLQYPNSIIFGEDVGKKGGVYQVTAGLMQKFGRRRVFDTLLDEQTILGTAIGTALNGFLPIPEIQFLAYLHNAEDQIRGEAATQSFFSNGQFTNPMVLRLPGLAYQKGFGGHFHNDNAFGFLREIPGLIVACPSNGRDAALLLRECVRLAWEEQRVVIFLEPIALYMERDLHEKGDQKWLFEYPALQEIIPFGKITTYGRPADTVIISYGNGLRMSLQAQSILEKMGFETRVIDLHWLAPLPIESLFKEIKSAKKIFIVDECRKTGSLSEQLVTAMVEHFKVLPKITRITGKDCFITLGQTWQYLLPNHEDIVTAIKKQG
jgi:2-oxoisovalerate dehydrogenase E1 component